MRMIYADITLRNANEMALVKKGVMHESEVKSSAVNAMCDSWSLYACSAGAYCNTIRFA